MKKSMRSLLNMLCESDLRSDLRRGGLWENGNAPNFDQQLYLLSLGVLSEK